MLGLIDIRLKEAFSENNNKSFSDRSVIIFGNFGQLPPILDLLIYTDTISRDVSSNNRLVTYKQFRKMYELDIIQWQLSKSEEQQGFRNILLRLKEGNSSLED